MPNRIFLAALGPDVIFLATGCLELGFFRPRLHVQQAVGRLGGRAQSDLPNVPVRRRHRQRQPHHRRLLLRRLWPPVSDTRPTQGLRLPRRHLRPLQSLPRRLPLGHDLDHQGWLLPIYVAQDPSVQELIQASFTCCGYFNHTSPAFVTDSTCPSPAAAVLRGCSVSISSFANISIDNVFTALFGMVGISAVLILAIACLLKDRKERERYRHIDEKNGFLQF